MRETVRRAGRATAQLALAVGLTAFYFAFITVLLITAIGTVAVVGIWLLPETVLLIRRIAGAKRSMVAAGTRQAARTSPSLPSRSPARFGVGCGPRPATRARSPTCAGWPPTTSTAASGFWQCHCGWPDCPSMGRGAGC